MFDLITGVGERAWGARSPTVREQGRGFRLVPPGALERLDHQGAFELLEIDPARGQFHSITKMQGTSRRRREIGTDERLPFREQHRPLDRVAQFPDVPGPRIAYVGTMRPRRRSRSWTRIRPDTTYGLPNDLR